MRSVLPATVAFIVALSSLLISQVGVADAAFHCMRIHAVAGGHRGDNNIQYVELRLDMAGHTFVGGHVIQFFNTSGQLKATFTFPTGVTNGSAGDSILVATSEFNAAAAGGAADFTFSATNTTGANGGDPLHPVQVPGGSVVFAGTSSPCFTGQPAPVDSAAYGAATATYGTAATALPNPGTLQALRLSNLNNPPTNNSTEYALQNVSAGTGTVAPGNLTTDYTTPRNNGRAVLRLPPASVGGVTEKPAIAPVAVAKARSSGRDWRTYEVAGGVAVAFAGLAAAWYAFRRRAL